MQDTELVVIMVAHDHIKENLDRLQGMQVLDTKNICGDDAYKL